MTREGPRPAQIERLVKAMIDGMREEAKNSTGAEVVSAMVTIAKRGLEAARESGTPSAKLTAAVMQLLDACGIDTEEKPN